MTEKPVTRFATTIVALALCVGVSGAAPATATKPGATPTAPAETTAATQRALGVQDSPGYVPPADPESASVRTGRRAAKMIDLPLTGGRRSLDALARAIVAALGTPSADSLFALCVTKEEFTKILWPEFPQSRPATGWSGDDAWMVLYPRLHSGAKDAWIDARDHRYRFVRMERAEPARPYTNFRLHDGITIVVLDELDQTQRLTFVRSLVERKGVFKIYSLDD